MLIIVICIIDISINVMKYLYQHFICIIYIMWWNICISKSFVSLIYQLMWWNICISMSPMWCTPVIWTFVLTWVWTRLDGCRAQGRESCMEQTEGIYTSVGLGKFRNISSLVVRMAKPVTLIPKSSVSLRYSKLGFTPSDLLYTFFTLCN